MREGLAFIVHSLASLGPWDKARVGLCRVYCSHVGGKGEEEEDKVQDNQSNGETALVVLAIQIVDWGGQGGWSAAARCDEGTRERGGK